MKSIMLYDAFSGIVRVRGIKAAARSRKVFLKDFGVFARLGTSSNFLLVLEPSVSKKMCFRSQPRALYSVTNQVFFGQKNDFVRSQPRALYSTTNQVFFFRVFRYPLGVKNYAISPCHPSPPPRTMVTPPWTRTFALEGSRPLPSPSWRKIPAKKVVPWSTHSRPSCRSAARKDPGLPTPGRRSLTQGDKGGRGYRENGDVCHFAIRAFRLDIEIMSDVTVARSELFFFSSSLFSGGWGKIKL